MPRPQTSHRHIKFWSVPTAEELGLQPIPNFAKKSYCATDVFTFNERHSDVQEFTPRDTEETEGTEARVVPI